MGSDFNPYAAPQSSVDTESAAGARVYREGKLVRMEIDGTLPDRCIRCNGPAEGYRVERSLYWRPDWWRRVIWAGLPSLFVLGLLDVRLMLVFWAGLLAFPLGDVFARRKIVVEYGLCGAHRQLRTGVMAAFTLSWVLVIGLALASASRKLRAVDEGWFWLLALVMVVLAIVAGFMRGMRLAGRSDRHVWLKGANRSYYEALPAAAGEQSA